MFRFTIRDVLWLMVVVALGIVVMRDRWTSAVAPVALEGYCPVTLVQSQKWHLGDTRFVAVYQGRRHQFVSAAKRETFLAAPERYSPAHGGNDAVRLIDESRKSAGLRKHGLMYDSHIYLFDSEESLQKFNANPARYLQHP